MDPIVISGVVFACLFGGALLGMLTRAALHEHHLSADTKDIVKLGTGLIGTMAALILGLLVASAKSSYDQQQSDLTQMSAKTIFLDRVLANYGPEAKETRELLRSAVAGAINRIWPEENSGAAQLDPAAGSGEPLYVKIHELAPQNETQKLLKAEALSLATNIAQSRWQLFEEAGSSISVPFLVVVIFWLTIIFFSFGLFAPRNAVVITTLFLCALSVAGAIFLILDLNSPFSGILRIPSTSMRNALAHLGK